MIDNDYMSKVKAQIEHDKLLNEIKPQYKEKFEKLYKKKTEIIQRNGIFIEFQLKIINSKINRIKNKN